MVSSFKEAMIENAESGLVFGNASHFAETGVYVPAEAAERTVIVVAMLRELAETSDEIVERDQEELLVWVCKNPDCARGGVASPGDGDIYRRPGEDVESPWSFQRVMGETSGEWKLLFARRPPRRYGPRQ